MAGAVGTVLAAVLLLGALGAGAAQAKEFYYKGVPLSQNGQWFEFTNYYPGYAHSMVIRIPEWNAKIPCEVRGREGLAAAPNKITRYRMIVEGCTVYGERENANGEIIEEKLPCVVEYKVGTSLQFNLAGTADKLFEAGETGQQTVRFGGAECNLGRNKRFTISELEPKWGEVESWMQALPGGADGYAITPISGVAQEIRISFEMDWMDNPTQPWSYR